MFRATNYPIPDIFTEISFVRFGTFEMSERTVETFKN